MKVLVTGNLGYIGPVLAEHAKKEDPKIQLVGIDMGLFQTDFTTQNKAGDCLYDEQIYQDVRSLDAKVFNEIDAVVALAAVSNDPMGKSFSEATYQVNCDAVISNAKAAKNSGVKSFIFASSCSVYGAGGLNAKNEDDEVNPLTDYAKSKLMCEEKLKDLADDKFKVICLRFATACGVSSRTRLDLVLNDFVWTFLASGKINILSDGTPLRPIIDVQDMSRAICWASKYQCPENFLVLNCGNNINNFSVFELASKVVEDDLDKISINKDAQVDKRSYKVDFSKYEKLTGFNEPYIKIDETIKNLKSQFLELISSSESPQKTMEFYKRHNKLNSLIKNNFLSKELRWL